MAKHLLAPPQGRCIALLSPPLFTSSSIDSCVPIHYKKQNKMATFFHSVKGIAVPKVLMVAGNYIIAKLTI